MKQTSIKKMLALFLIAAVMLAAFTACAEKAPDTAQTQPPASAAAVTAEANGCFRAGGIADVALSWRGE